MTTDLNDPHEVVKLWNDTFEKITCDWVKANGEHCRLIPVHLDKTNGQRLCYVHAPIRFKYVKEANDASAVRTGS